MFFKVHELPPEKLKNREVVRIDISNDQVATSDYKREEDPSLFKSKKTNRGPLVGNWIEKVSSTLKMGNIKFSFIALSFIVRRASDVMTRNVCWYFVSLGGDFL